MNLRSTALSVVVLFGASLGCTDDGASPPLTLEAFYGAWASSYCQHFQRCQGPGPVASELGMFDDVASCGVALRGAARRIFRGHTEAVAVGRLRFDGGAARRCVDELAARCGVSMRDPELCPEAFPGAVASGGVCQASDECEGDNYCRGDAGAATCPGRCVSRKARAQPCETDEECSRAGLTGAPACVRAVAGPYWTQRTGACGERTQGDPVGVGAPCGLVPLDQTHARHHPCGAGSYCPSLPLRGQDVPRCLATLSQGSPCVSSDPCERGACVVASGSLTGTCTAFRLVNDVGGGCDTTSTPFCNVARRLRCGGPPSATTCSVVSDGARGAACEIFLNHVSCASALPEVPGTRMFECQWDWPTPSIFDFGCQEGLSCGHDGHCHAPEGGLGATCTENGDCRSGACDRHGAEPQGRCVERACATGP